MRCAWRRSSQPTSKSRRKHFSVSRVNIVRILSTQTSHRSQSTIRSTKEWRSHTISISNCPFEYLREQTSWTTSNGCAQVHFSAHKKPRRPLTTTSTTWTSDSSSTTNSFRIRLHQQVLFTTIWRTKVRSSSGFLSNIVKSQWKECWTTKSALTSFASTTIDFRSGTKKERNSDFSLISSTRRDWQQLTNSIP